MNEKEIKYWLEIYEVENYTIQSDLTVDLAGNLILISQELSFIPIKFNIIKGSVYIENNRFTSLDGFSKRIEKNIYCSNNPLTSLALPSTYLGGEIVTNIYFKEMGDFFGKGPLYRITKSSLSALLLQSELSNTLDNKNSEPRKKI